MEETTKSERRDRPGRRDTIAVTWHDASIQMEISLRDLRKIWDEVGLSKQVRDERLQTAVWHIYKLIDEMIEEEVQMKESIERSVEQLREKVVKEKQFFMVFMESFCVIQIKEAARDLRMFEIPWPENQESLKLVDAEQSLIQVFEKLEQKRQHLTSSYNDLLQVKSSIK